MHVTADLTCVLWLQRGVKALLCGEFRKEGFTGRVVKSTFSNQEGTGF